MGAAGSVGLSGLLDALLKDSDKLTAEEKLNRENLIGSIVVGLAESSGLNSNESLTSANTELENNYLGSGLNLGFVQLGENRLVLYTPEEQKNIKLTAEQTLIVRDLLVDFSIVGTPSSSKQKIFLQIF